MKMIKFLNPILPLERKKRKKDRRTIMHRFHSRVPEFTTAKGGSSVKKNILGLYCDRKIWEALIYNVNQLFQTGQVEHLFCAQLGLNLILEATMESF